MFLIANFWNYFNLKIKELLEFFDLANQNLAPRIGNFGMVRFAGLPILIFVV